VIGRETAPQGVVIASDFAIKSRRTIQTPIVIMGDLALLTKQELAEFIDSLDEDESATVATDRNAANIGYSG
jgi:2-phospho-L-lactate guanylyltransferase (CobY/MobA/RfbA family)